MGVQSRVREVKNDTGSFHVTVTRPALTAGWHLPNSDSTLPQSLGEKDLSVGQTKNFDSLEFFQAGALGGLGSC